MDGDISDVCTILHLNAKFFYLFRQRLATHGLDSLDWNQGISYSFPNVYNFLRF